MNLHVEVEDMLREQIHERLTVVVATTLGGKTFLVVAHIGRWVHEAIGENLRQAVDNIINGYFASVGLTEEDRMSDAAIVYARVEP